MPKIISHRGAAGLALENSFESIQAALGLDLYAIEIDVRATKDGNLILMHDRHTGHVANETLIVQNSTLAELRALTLHNGEQIPTLDEALQRIGDQKRVMLDLKSNGVADQVLKALAAHPQVKAIYSGRQYEESQRIHRAMPDAPFLVQSHFDALEVIRLAKRFGAQGICVNFWLMNPLAYRLARKQRLDVYVYKVNHGWQQKFFARLYPDAILISDHPERLTSSRT